MTTRTQLRATCPCCFGTWALIKAGMSQHGYTREYGWNQGACYGQGKPHFGTPGGRDVAAKLADSLENWAETRLAWAGEVQAGQRDDLVTDYKGKLIAKPEKRHRDASAARLQGQARMALSDVERMREAVAGWKPAEPVPVEVETKSGPTVHAVGTYWTGRFKRNIGLCVASAYAAQKFFSATTDDPAKVTCKACLRELNRTKS